MNIPLLDRSCKYYAIGAMIYRSTVPEDLAGDADLRLKLTIDEPVSTHLSGLLRIATADAARLSSLVSTDWSFAQNLVDGPTVAGLLLVFLLALCALGRMWLPSRRIELT